MFIGSGSYLLFTVYTYIKIYKKVAQSRKLVTQSLPGEHNIKTSRIIRNQLFHQGHTTALMIVVTYALLVYVPTLITFIADTAYVHLSLRSLTIIFKVQGVCTSLDFISDATIYIFMNKEIKLAFRKKVNNFSKSFRELRFGSVTPTEEHIQGTRTCDCP